MAIVCVDLCDGRGPIAVDDVARARPDLRDLPYFAEVAEVAGDIAHHVDRFVISYGSDIDRGLTARDVWFLVGDETSMPVPWNPSCPVFRTYGDRYVTPSRGGIDIALRTSEALLWARNALRARLTTWPHPLARPRTSGWLPLGHPGVDPLPADVPQIARRTVDIGFRGSLGGGRSWSPRTITRQRLGLALDQLPADISRDLLSTATFGESFGRTGTDYVEALLETKIAPVPRGGSLETFRTFEAAACGCVLITEPLPRAWYYGGLPRAEVTSWSELRHVCGGLLADPDLMQVMADGARRWALEVISAPAVGRWVARALAASPERS